MVSCSYGYESQVIGSLCLSARGCALVGNRPSMSGRYCHSYINKADGGDGQISGGVNAGIGGERALRLDGFSACVCVSGVSCLWVSRALMQVNSVPIKRTCGAGM